MKEIFEITAVWNNNHYNHFGIHPKLASVYGDKPEDIETLKMKISNEQTIPKLNNKYKVADYWGWYDNEKKKFTLIYAQYFLLNICFPYGLKAQEERGDGKAYRLEIIKENETL